MASPRDAASARIRAARKATVALTAYLCASCPMSDDARAGDSTDGIAVSEYVETADGARLYLEARGDHANAPLAIWLHGGPGGAERPLFRYFNSGLERRLLVVYYDQRGAGRSFDPAAPAASLDIARHVADLDRVVDHLRSRHRHDRVLLIGHSWGAALGMLFAEAHPEKVAGVVCVAPVVSSAEEHRREYAYDMAEAARRDDQNALRELSEIGPPPYGTSRPVIRLQRVTERYRGVEFQPRNHAAIVFDAILRGLVTPWEIFRFIQGNQFSLDAMHQELIALDMRSRVARVDAPVFFFLGRHDHHVDAGLAAEYFATLRAPYKELVWFEQSAHDIPFDEPQLFEAWIVEAARGIGLLPIAPK